MLNKYKSFNVRAADVDDRQIKGYILVALAYNSRTLPIIEYVPNYNPITTSFMFIEAPDIIRLQ